MPGLPNVYAVGDTVNVAAWNGDPVPGLAAAAKQGGQFVARAISARLNEETPPAEFKYQHMGSMATIGRKAAVAEFGWFKLSGAPAWWLWGAVHVAFLANMRSRISVAIDWFWAYLTFRSSTRLLTGRDG